MSILIRIYRLLVLFLFYMREMLVSNLRVAYDILTPRHHMRPGFVAVPLDARSDVEILAVANLISMTPGSLSVEISADRRTLFVHAMYIKDVAELRRKIKDDLERRVLEVLR
ncbi:MAG: Na+/H+ antiporter subunit E [Acidobacteria bacterium]|nr:Na+/H+ antiporter subunit E [Acidobacteriota bacterium]